MRFKFIQVYSRLVYTQIAQRRHEAYLWYVARVSDLDQRLVGYEIDKQLGWLVDKVRHPAHTARGVEDRELGGVGWLVSKLAPQRNLTTHKAGARLLESDVEIRVHDLLLRMDRQDCWPRPLDSELHDLRIEYV